jgi:hypothetical protein
MVAFSPMMRAFCSAVEHVLRGGSGIVHREVSLNALKQRYQDNGLNRNVDDERWTVKLAGARVPLAKCPFACRIACIGQDLLQGTDAECGARPGSLASLLSHLRVFLTPSGPEFPSPSV